MKTPIFRRLRTLSVTAVLFAVMLCSSGCVSYVGNSGAADDRESKSQGYMESPMFDGDTATSEENPKDTSLPGESVADTENEGTTEIVTQTDISSYESYMDPGRTTDYLTLVSPAHKLSEDYAPTDLLELADTRKDGRATQKMREYAANSMEAMFTELRAAGYTDVSITSAYRSYVYQESIFNGYLAQHNYDYDYVATFSNPPGSSEHQLGLCADLHNLPSADVAFADTEAYVWLRDNCWKFGFILRYPEDKVEVTGISFEPWHYRYVGRYHAKRIYDEGLCLEEYIENYYPELADKSPVN